MPVGSTKQRILTAEWVLPVFAGPIRGGYVILEGSRIAAVGALDDCPGLPPPRPGSLITPGLVNTHAHLEQSYPQPIPKAAEAPFSRWLLDVVALTRAGRTCPEKASAEKAGRCRQGAEELLRTGTTCVNDIASGWESLEILDAMGLRGVVSLEFFHPASEPVRVDSMIAAYEAFRDGYEGHPRLRAGLSPHSGYNVSPAAWRALREACHPPVIHAHAAEWAGEAAWFQGGDGDITRLHETLLGQRFFPPRSAETPIRHLADWGLLDNRTILAHVTRTTPDDRVLLARHGVGVAHCPRSNLFLHGETLCAADWADSGVPLGLGTDGRLSVENLDLRAEARCAMRQHGWSARQALDVLTLGGARVLGLERDIGSLAVGKRADLVLWQASPSPAEDDPAKDDPNEGEPPEERLMRETTRVDAVYVDGIGLLEASLPEAVRC
jgi:5-methylthioadenosine/S-adenosylhomocysteine deaminase